MGLTWDITKAKDIPREEDGSVTEEFYPILENLIWQTMFTDIGWEITEDNVKEFYARIHATQLLDGYPKEHMTKYEDVRKVIGLHVNVAPKTRLQWQKKVMGFSMNRIIMDVS